MAKASPKERQALADAFYTSFTTPSPSAARVPARHDDARRCHILVTNPALLGSSPGRANEEGETIDESSIEATVGGRDSDRAPRNRGRRVARSGAGEEPNILFIMGDDIGLMQPTVYHRGWMVGETPNIDRIAHEGGIFMDHSAMQSCTSGRAAFFTGMYPVRVGLTVP